MTVDEAVEFLKKSANGANVEISMKVIVTRPVRFSASKRMEYMQNVLDLVESEYEVNEAMIKNADRKREVVEARQILFYILKTSRFYFSFKELGRLFNRDHTSVMHAVNKVKDLQQVDLEFKEKLNKILPKVEIL